MSNVLKYSLIATVVLLAVGAWSQEFPAGELNLDYSYVRYAPNVPGSKGHSFNGGGGSIVFDLNRFLGIKADFQGYGSTTSNFLIAPNATFPSGVNANVQGNLFTYLFGPQIKVHAHRAQPFVHMLFGGAHSNVYANAFKNICLRNAGLCAFSTAPSNNTFAFAFGGGIDIPIGHSVAIRPAEIDYLYTNFSNRFNNSNQNNFRYSGGITFNLGTRGGGP